MKWIVFVLFFLLCGTSWLALIAENRLGNLETVMWLLASALASAVTAFVISWILKQSK